ncbi:hypothetical protein RYE99_00135 [Wolbachia endosymbiont of Drosophila seguyi]|nr:hypothetical protein [Wolbachia endosymbiont of Drosophila seguyi]
MNVFAEVAQKLDPSVKHWDDIILFWIPDWNDSSPTSYRRGISRSR